MFFPEVVKAVDRLEIKGMGALRTADLELPFEDDIEVLEGSPFF